jgi:MFS family permease
MAPNFLALGFLQIVIGAWLVTVGFTAVQAGLLISVQGVTTIVASVPLGIVSDVYGRKHVLLLGSIAGAAALLAFSLTTNYGYLVAISAVSGLAEGASLTTWNALLADITEVRERNRVFSYSFVMTNVMTGAGLVIPGLFPALEGLFGVSGYSLHRETLLLLGSVSFLTPMLLASMLWRYKEAHNPSRRWAGFKNGRTLLKLGVTWTTIGLGAGFVVPLLGSWFYYRFGVTDDYSGPILAVSTILTGVSSAASPWLAMRFGQLRAIVLTTGSSTLFMLSMAFAPTFGLAAGIYIVRATLMNLSGPLSDSFSMSIFPAEQRGLVSALSNILFRLPNSFGTYFGGFILGARLLQLPFFIATALYVAGLGSFYAFFVKNDPLNPKSGKVSVPSVS